MKIFPENALVHLELEKVKALLAALCQTEFAKKRAEQLRIHTRLDFIELELGQTHEYQLMRQTGLSFQYDFTQNIYKELKLLGIAGATLTGEQFMLVHKLAEAMGGVFRWFDAERRAAFPNLSRVLDNSYYEKNITIWIAEVLEPNGVVKDNASPELQQIRQSLYRKRNELRRLFGRLANKYSKQGYTTDIEESFINGRRVMAVFAEHKRIVKGILHGESDSRKTSFIEPEETIELNNEIFSLENEELQEVHRILHALTIKLSIYSPLLLDYLRIMGLFDFIKAKAMLAADMQACLPKVVDKAHLYLEKAYHPLLYLYNRTNKKETIPLNIELSEKDRILVISGPNAGGKTVALKTIGLLQLMLQSGLLVPVSPQSVMGIFKQLMIHMGDTQSLEFELSTYSSHLKHMKHFIENCNGKTLFFIDELGGGSDPNLGGAFAEVILEELARKHSMGVVTTHYLNLKVMANKVQGIMNGAMAFDEQNLLPLYRLSVGKPGSSYTFSIAERIGLPKNLIERARRLVDESHFKLDRLLNTTEQDRQKIDQEKKELNKLMRENEQMKREMKQLMDKEKHRQQVELLREQNKMKQEQLDYLKDMDRKLKALVNEWKRSDKKEEVVKMIHAVLFKQKEKQVKEKQQVKFNSKYELAAEELTVGSQVQMIKNRQVGVVKEIRDKKVIVQLGVVPITVNRDEVVVVKMKGAEV
jgi:DNA mismatch repair protein MutS2